MWGYIIGGFLVASIVPAVVQVGFQYYILPKLRGRSQESNIDKMFRKFKGSGFARVKDVMLRMGDRTNQIDNLLITRHGIFVIESKNYSGVIQGRERSPRWQQIHPSGKYKPREFYNPIWQNEGHIRALKKLLGHQYPRVPYYNLVVFSDKCRCPQIPGVVTVSEMNKTIKEFLSGPPVLSESDVATLKVLLDRSNVKDRQSRSEHLEHVQAAAAYAKEQERRAIIRERAEKNMESALKIRNMISAGRDELIYDDRFKGPGVEKLQKLSLESQMAAAASLVDKGEATAKGVELER